MLQCVPVRSIGIVQKSVDDSYGVRNISGHVATIAYIREPTTGAYGIDFISSPSAPDVG